MIGYKKFNATFLNKTTLKKLKEVYEHTTKNGYSILEVIKDDGSKAYYPSNYYNLETIKRYFNKGVIKKVR